MKSKNRINGPIPGENFTEDTKNFPWHRPPDMADFVTIVETAIRKMNKSTEMGKLQVMLENGETILDYTTGMLRIAVSEGKIPIDMAVLAAGPIARMAEAIAEAGNFKYKRGWDQQPSIPTPAKYRLATGKGSRPSRPKGMEGPLVDDAPVQEDAGFMSDLNGPAPKDEQAAMLGQSE